MGKSRRSSGPVSRTRPRPRSALEARLRRRPPIASGIYWAIYAADEDDGAYLLIDAEGLSEALSPPDRRELGGLVEILRFATTQDRNEYVRSRGWRRTRRK